METSKSWTIREATAADYHGVCELLDEVGKLHREALPLVFCKPEGSVRSVEFVAEILSDENAALFVAECAGELAGLAQVHIHVSSSPLPIIIPRRFGMLDAVGVSERFRRRGMARALVHRAEKWVVEQRVDDFQIGVWEFNKEALSLYEKLGYSTVYRTLSKRLEAED
jgi:ribosomal protein S18 acetylase RimI-like enzyme